MSYVLHVLYVYTSIIYHVSKSYLIIYFQKIEDYFQNLTFADNIDVTGVPRSKRGTCYHFQDLYRFIRTSHLLS